MCCLKQLRCSSLRLEYDNSGILCINSKKYYYNYSKNDFQEILKSLDVSLRYSIFEYSLNDKVFGFNFRMPQDPIKANIFVQKSIGNLSRVYYNLYSFLGMTFANITSGIKIVKDTMQGYVFYFYPVCSSAQGKLKMSGISRLSGCHSFLFEINSHCLFLQTQYLYEFSTFADICFELKGCSLWCEGNKFGYNIFIKCSNREIRSFFVIKHLNSFLTK